MKFFIQKGIFNKIDMMINKQRFGIHKATGIDIATPKVKPSYYSLVERGQIVMTVPRESYAILIAKRKELAMYGRKCEIMPIW